MALYLSMAVAVTHDGELNVIAGPFVSRMPGDSDTMASAKKAYDAAIEDADFRAEVAACLLILDNRQAGQLDFPPPEKNRAKKADPFIIVEKPKPRKKMSA